MVHSCNLALYKAEAERSQIRICQGNLARPCSKNILKWAGMQQCKSLGFHLLVTQKKNKNILVKNLDIKC